MTPAAAVEQVAAIVAPRAHFTENDVYARLAEARIPTRVADLAYKSTQLAWGRTVLDGLGIHFSDEYFCLNAAGEIVESGRLAKQPY